MSRTSTLSPNKPLFSASLVFYGGVCAVILLCALFSSIAGVTGPPFVPGFFHMTGLCYPFLYFWAGLLVRDKWKTCPLWMKWLAGAVATASIIIYCRAFDVVTHSFYQYAAMFCLGLIIPTREKGLAPDWVNLLLALASIFCFTAVSIVNDRLYVIPFSLEQEDLQRLLEGLLSAAEPLLAIQAAFFVMEFSFSAIMLKIVSYKVVRYAVAILCLLSFALMLMRVFTNPIHYTVGGVDYIPLLHLAVHPVIIYALVRFLQRNRIKN